MSPRIFVMHASNSYCFLMWRTRHFHFRLTNQQCKSPIRQTAVSFDGRYHAILSFLFVFSLWMHGNVTMMFSLSSTILGAGEDGTIWRWDEVDHWSEANRPASYCKIDQAWGSGTWLLKVGTVNYGMFGCWLCLFSECYTCEIPAFKWTS
jgi:hypothetical protein